VRPVCMVCGEPVSARNSVCGDCTREGHTTPIESAYFDTQVDAIAYGESRYDWPRFRVRHLSDHVFVVYSIGGGL